MLASFFTDSLPYNMLVYDRNAPIDIKITLPSDKRENRLLTLRSVGCSQSLKLLFCWMKGVAIK